MCAINKYSPHMPKICHMPSLFAMNLWSRHAHIHATYEVAPINDVARTAVQPDSAG